MGAPRVTLRSRGGRVGFAEQTELKGCGRSPLCSTWAEGEPCRGLSCNPLLPPERRCRLQFIPVYLLVGAGTLLLGVTLLRGSKCRTTPYPPPSGAARPAPIPLHPNGPSVRSALLQPQSSLNPALLTPRGGSHEPGVGGHVPGSIAHPVGPQPYSRAPMAEPVGWQHAGKWDAPGSALPLCGAEQRWEMCAL